MSTFWKNQQAERSQQMGSNAIREILKITQRSDVISFAGGLPAPELFPVEKIKNATIRLMDSPQAQIALQYHVSEGYLPLRELFVDLMQKQGLTCNVDNILITSGSQQGLDLIGKVLIENDDIILVENPTYLGMLHAWKAYQPNFIAVDTDVYGMIPEALEATLKTHKPKLIYLVPNFQNPTGVTTTAERRAEIVRLARHYSVPLVEDDPYGALRYEGEHIAPVIAYDSQFVEDDSTTGIDSGQVIYLGTFSKMLCPGFRIGFMVAPTYVTRLFTQAKQGSDLHTNTFGQMVAYEVAKDGYLQQHIDTLIDIYRNRRDLMLQLVEELFPEGVQWNHPEGGLFLWGEFPEGVDSTELLSKAVEDENVAFVPGQPFFADGHGANTFRLNFSNARPEQIEEGMLRLARILKATLINEN